MAPNLKTKIIGFWVSYELVGKEGNLIRKQFTTLDFGLRQKLIINNNNNNNNNIIDLNNLRCTTCTRNSNSKIFLGYFLVGSGTK